MITRTSALPLFSILIFFAIQVLGKEPFPETTLYEVTPPSNGRQISFDEIRPYRVYFRTIRLGKHVDTYMSLSLPIGVQVEGEKYLRETFKETYQKRYGEPIKEFVQPKSKTAYLAWWPFIDNTLLRGDFFGLEGEKAKASFLLRIEKDDKGATIQWKQVSDSTARKNRVLLDSKGRLANILMVPSAHDKARKTHLLFGLVQESLTAWKALPKVALNPIDNAWIPLVKTPVENQMHLLFNSKDNVFDFVWRKQDRWVYVDNGSVVRAELFGEYCELKPHEKLVLNSLGKRRYSAWQKIDDAKAQTVRDVFSNRYWEFQGEQWVRLFEPEKTNYSRDPTNRFAASALRRTKILVLACLDVSNVLWQVNFRWWATTLIQLPNHFFSLMLFFCKILRLHRWHLSLPRIYSPRPSEIQAPFSVNPVNN